MNVSRNAYFTSEYLQDRQYRQQKNLRISPESARSQVSKAETGTPFLPKHNSTSPKEESLNLGPEDDLGKEITPAELNYLSSQRKVHRTPRHSVDYYDYYGSRETRKKRPLKTNEPRSARSFFKRHVSDHEFPYDANEVGNFCGDDTSLYEPSIPQQEPFSGFYIEQEKRLQSSPDYKPNAYTHKTFKDVFPTDEEERLNPIDVVFDDPNQRVMNRKQKFTRALKQVKTKLGKNDYAHYDYSRKQDHDEPANLSIKGEFDDPESKDPTPETFVEKEQTKSPGRKIKSKQSRDTIRKKQSKDGLSEQEKMADTRSPGLKSQLRRKMRIPKTYSEINSESDFEEEKELSPVGTEVEFESSNQTEPSSSYNPFWDYMLSWAAFNNLKPAQDLDDGKITEIRDTASPEYLIEEGEMEEVKENPSKSRGKGQKYKKFLQNWNTPASKYIADHEQQRKVRALVKVSKKNSMVGDGTETEMQDDEEEQFVLNPQTGQLEPVRPGENFDGQTQILAGRLHEGSPTTIVSNINKLIKSIRIMRIIFAPIDVVAENFPQIQTLVIFIELFIFMWILYELSLLIDALCMAIKAVCAPMIAIGRFMNRIV